MTYEVPPPHPELMRLRPLLGTWTARERTQGSVLGHGVTVTSREPYTEDGEPYTEDGEPYTGAVADGRLTFEGPARFQYGLDDDGEVRVNPEARSPSTGGSATPPARGRRGCATRSPG